MITRGPTKGLWRGRPIQSLSRNELEEAFLDLAESEARRHGEVMALLRTGSTAYRPRWRRAWDILRSRTA